MNRGRTAADKVGQGGASEQTPVEQVVAAGTSGSSSKRDEDVDMDNESQQDVPSIVAPP